MSKIINSKLLIVVLLFSVLFCAGCDEKMLNDTSDDGIQSGALGYEYNPRTDISIHHLGEMVWLEDCPIHANQFQLPIDFDDTVKINAVGDHSFNHNSEIIHLIVPDGYMEIGHFSFMDCQNLVTIEIGKDLCSIGELSFTGCPNLSNIIVAEENTYFYTNEGCLLERGTNRLVITNGIIPQNTKIIGPSVFADFSCDALDIPEGLIEIESLAFQGSKLRVITLPFSLATIGDHAFASCDLLETVYIPASVSSIGKELFGGSNGSQITVYCEAKSKPEGWSNDWLKGAENVTVVWGYQPE